MGAVAGKTVRSGAEVVGRGFVACVGVGEAAASGPIRGRIGVIGADAETVLTLSCKSSAMEEDFDGDDCGTKRNKSAPCKLA